MTATRRMIRNADRFRRWVEEYRVARLAEALTLAGQPTKRQQVYTWLSGQHEPTPARIRAIATIAAGAVSLEDIHDYLALAGDAYLVRAAPQP